jgi:hypothetical protein
MSELHPAPDNPFMDCSMQPEFNTNTAAHEMMK